jgi:prepilin-type N-terminal cleavage/methylation domain-containing protein
MKKQTQSSPQRFAHAPVPLNNELLFDKGTGAGFTLIEILVVIGMIAILATIVIIAINPARQFAQGRNSQRVSNVNTILNAIGQRIADNKGVFAGSFDNGNGTSTCISLATSTPYDIASTGSGTIDLSCLTPTYIPSGLPFDPSASGADWNSATSYDTKYQVSLDSNGRYTVSAPSAELGQSIAVTR